MGNCLTGHKVSAQDVELKHQPAWNVLEEQAEKVGKTESSCTLHDQNMGSAKAGRRGKNVVSFQLHEDDDAGGKGTDENSRDGRVRIRVVVTRQELKQILDVKNNKPHPSSLEQLLSVVKLRGIRMVSESRDSDSDRTFNTPWKPALESIPENS